MQYQTMWPKQHARRPRRDCRDLAVSRDAAAPPMALPKISPARPQRPSAAGETPPANAGPLTPIHRDATAGERPAAKAPPAVKAPATPKPATATAPAVATATPSARKPKLRAKASAHTAASAHHRRNLRRPRSARREEAASSTSPSREEALAASGQIEKSCSCRPHRRARAAPSAAKLETAQRRTRLSRLRRSGAGRAPGWGYAARRITARRQRKSPPPHTHTRPPGITATAARLRPYTYGPYSGCGGRGRCL